MENMKPYQTGLTSMLLHILALPLFLFMFLLLYRSEWMLQWLYMVDGRWYHFNIIIISLIVAGVLCASRIPMTVCKIRMAWYYYALWTLAEVVVSAFFCALYMALMYKGLYTYFQSVGYSFMMLFAVLIYGYAIINLIIAHKKDDKEDVPEASLIRFEDYTGRLKLVIASEKILYIEAEENYSNIRYIDGENLNEYSLRNSLTRLQPLMEKHDIVRCQRKYYVNPKHVKVLRKDKEGVIIAELDVSGVKPIPVSPKYYDELNSKLL